jgi:hypothetical protein
MKKALMIGVFFAFAASAHAQVGLYGSLNNTQALSDSGGLNGMRGINATDGGSLSGIPHAASPSTANVSDTNPGEFIPSHFEGYADAVSEAKALANRRPMTVAEMARAAQADKKAAEGKKVMVLEQGSDGKLVILEPTASAATAAAAVTAPAANSDAASVPVATTRPATEEKK